VAMIVYSRRRISLRCDNGWSRRSGRRGALSAAMMVDVNQAAQGHAASPDRAQVGSPACIREKWAGNLPLPCPVKMGGDDQNTSTGDPPAGNPGTALWSVTPGFPCSTLSCGYGERHYGWPMGTLAENGAEDSTLSKYAIRVSLRKFRGINGDPDFCPSSSANQPPFLYSI